jgi:cytochrome c-type biogenesis protein CcmH
LPIVLLVAFALVLTLSAGVAQAQGPDPPANSGQALSYDEAEAQSIDRMLMCPVCPAETIDQAQVELARQMRRLVREMLAQGAGREEILEFFADRYGPGVLAAPPKSGLNLLAWAVPVVGVLAALGAGLLVLRSMAGQGAGASDAGPPLDDGLAPYLEAIDRDLGLPGRLAGEDHGPGERLGGAEESRRAGGASGSVAATSEPPWPEPPRKEG